MFQLFQRPTCPLLRDSSETIEKYWVINRSEYYRQQVFQAVENDKAQFASDNDTAIIQYIE